MIRHVLSGISKAMRVAFPAAAILAATAFFTPITGNQARATEGRATLPSFPWVAASWDDDALLMRIDGVREGTYELYQLEDPPRIVLDLPYLNCSDGQPVYESYDFTGIPLLTQLRASCNSERVRIVLESRYPIYCEITSPEDRDWLDVLCYLRFRQTVEEIEIDQGTRYTARRYVTPSGQRFAHVVISDPQYSRLRPRVLLASDVNTRPRDSLLASISGIVADSRAAAGINGGYFQWPGISLSLVIQYGQILAPPQLHRPAFMVLENGEYTMDYPPIKARVTSSSGIQWDVDVVNQVPGYGQVALLTPGHPSRLRNGMAGQYAVFRDGIVECVTSEQVEDFTNRTILWPRRTYPPLELLGIGEPVETRYFIDNGTVPIAHALQGGPFLIRNGRVNITSQQDDIGNDIANGRSARTAVGIDNDNRIYLVAIEGPGGGRSIGSTLQELAWTLLELGATWAINLDGGSSTGMSLGYVQPDSGLPSGGRQIASALVLIDESGRMQGEGFFF